MIVTKSVIKAVRQAFVEAAGVMLSRDKRITRLTLALEDAGALLTDQQNQLATQEFLITQYQKRIEVLSMALIGTVMQGRSRAAQLEGPPS